MGCNARAPRRDLALLKGSRGYCVRTERQRRPWTLQALPIRRGTEWGRAAHVDPNSNWLIRAATDIHNSFKVFRKYCNCPGILARYGYLRAGPRSVSDAATN